MSKEAIPTMYKGRRFRSRLEARWAAMFDLLQWRWEYEPRDCDGWIPDFEILGPMHTALVEVKPINRFNLAVAEEVMRARPADCYSILMLGVALRPYSGCVNLGWSVCWDQQLALPGQWRPVALLKNRITERYDVVVDGKPYLGLATGQLFDGTTGDLEPRVADAADRMWAEAGNLVQWKAA